MRTYSYRDVLRGEDISTVISLSPDETGLVGWIRLFSPSQVYPEGPVIEYRQQQMDEVGFLVSASPHPAVVASTVDVSLIAAVLPSVCKFITSNIDVIIEYWKNGWKIEGGSKEWDAFFEAFKPV